jgi:predicted AAA+ superfamily ATPase
MERAALQQLLQWKQREERKPLILHGARQVGKTWLAKEFARTAYEDSLYLSFFEDNSLETLLFPDLVAANIIKRLEILFERSIDPQKTLIIFDEIQEAPRALASLKSFCEAAKQYQIICAGSLLGLTLHEGVSFPVGKVEFLNLYPLSFSEYLKALGKNRHAELLTSGDANTATMFGQEFVEQLKSYYFVGGMPEVVSSFSQEKNYVKVQQLQKQILLAYDHDFSKHAPASIVPRIRMLWNSIPAQLAKENKKFIYGIIKEGARAKDYEAALLWLQDAGLIHRVNRVSTPKIPLKAYEDEKAFKLFVVDTGLLCCLSGIKAATILDGNRLFAEFKGALAEQFVLQHLLNLPDLQPYYWTNERNQAEIDFLVDVENEVIPIEVKAETNLRAKSLKTYHSRFNPRLSIRLSLANYERQSWLLNIPLYLIEQLPHLLRDSR